MAILTQVFREMSVPDLIAAVNAWFALQVDPAPIIVTQVSIIQNLLPRRQLKQAEFQCIITYNDAGAGAQTTPFVLGFAQAGDPDNLKVAADAIAAGAGVLFVSGFRIISQDEPAQLPTMIAWALTSTAAGAAANYTPA